MRNQVLEHSVRLLSWFLFGLWSIDLPGHVTAPQGPETMTGGGLPASPEIIIRVVPRSLLQHQKKGPHVDHVFLHVDMRFFTCYTSNMHVRKKTHVNIMRHMNMTWMFHVNMHFTDVNIQKMERAFICNMRV